MGRLLLMHEDGLLTWPVRLMWTFLVTFLVTVGGAANSATLYAKCGLLETFCYWVMTRTSKYGEPLMSAMADMPWIVPGPMQGAREKVFRHLHIES